MEIQLSLTELLFIMIVIVLLVSLVFLYFFSKVIGTYKSQLRSQSVKFGQISEQFIPLHNLFPWDSKQFRFLGSPIDGIQFDGSISGWASNKSSARAINIWMQGENLDPIKITCDEERGGMENTRYGDYCGFFISSFTYFA